MSVDLSPLRSPPPSLLLSLSTPSFTIQLQWVSLQKQAHCSSKRQDCTERCGSPRGGLSLTAGGSGSHLLPLETASATTFPDEQQAAPPPDWELSGKRWIQIRLNQTAANLVGTAKNFLGKGCRKVDLSSSTLSKYDTAIWGKNLKALLFNSNILSKKYSSKNHILVMLDVQPH